MVVRNKIQRDRELQNHIDTIIDKMTFTAVYQACVIKFGSTRSASRSTVGRYWLVKNNGHATRPPRSIIERNHELRSFIDSEKAGRTFEQLHALCCEVMGAERVPSLASINRYWIRAHGRTRRKRNFMKNTL